MEQAEEVQRPRQREQQIEQRGRIQAHRVPLGQERDAAIIVGIPEWQFAVPETLPLVMGNGIGKHSEVARDKGCQTGQDLRKGGKNHPPQHKPEPGRAQPAVFCGRLRAVADVGLRIDY